MSTYLFEVPQLTIVPEPRYYPDPDAYLFANALQSRRQELGLSMFEAADLCGLTIWQWAAVEEGIMVPTDRNLLLAISGTLQTNYFMLVLLANLSSIARELPDAA